MSVNPFYCALELLRWRGIEFCFWQTELTDLQSAYQEQHQIPFLTPLASTVWGFNSVHKNQSERPHNSAPELTQVLPQVWGQRDHLFFPRLIDLRKIKICLTVAKIYFTLQILLYRSNIGACTVFACAFVHCNTRWWLSRSLWCHNWFILVRVTWFALAAILILHFDTPGSFIGGDGRVTAVFLALLKWPILVVDH